MNNKRPAILIGKRLCAWELFWKSKGKAVRPLVLSTIQQETWFLEWDTFYTKYVGNLGEEEDFDPYDNFGGYGIGDGFKR